MRPNGSVEMRIAKIARRYMWSCKCGAMVTLGNDARYLRDVCAGLPPTPQLRRQKEALINGRDPYSAENLSLRAELVPVPDSATSAANSESNPPN